MSIDYALLALTSTREAFVAACPFGFLVGRFGSAKPARRHLTIDPRNPSLFDKTQRAVPAVSKTGGGQQLAVLAVRKVQETFPTMVSVGRTSNNDVVINDPLVSKFHAFFRLGENKLELFEAGSKNGTFLRGVQLAAKEPQVVHDGDEVRFGALSFHFRSAGATWDFLQHEKKR